MYQYLKKYMMYFWLVVFSANVVVPIYCKIDKQYVQKNTKTFADYLNRLRNKMRLPTDIIKKSMGLIGYAQHEIDAVPIAFPFIWDEQYKKVWADLQTDEFVAEVNKLLELLEPINCIAHHDERRKKAHQLIHGWNCKKIGLPQHTTTKQLAEFVKRKQINLEAFYHHQLVQFFVKYHLDL